MDNLATVLSAVGGTVLVLLVTTISISLLVLCYRRGILLWLPLPPKQGFEYDVFLSFADEDRELAQQVLYQPLSDHGYKVLLHLTDFIAGMTIEDNIIRAVKTSRVVIYLCSKNFSKSSFCQTELKYGIESHYTEYKGRYRRVIPIVIGGECPMLLNTFKIGPIRMTGSIEEYDKKRISKLIKMLKLGKPIYGKDGKVFEDGIELI